MENQDQIDSQKKIENTSTATNSGDNVTIGSVSGEGVFNIGNKITTGDINVEIDKHLEQNPNNEYLQGLKKLTGKLDQEFKNNNVPVEKQTEINKEVQELAKEVKDIKPGTKPENVSPSKQKQIDTKTTSLVEKIVDALPAASETIANWTPLSPFSKFIRGGVQSVVDAYKKFKNSKS